MVCRVLGLTAWACIQADFKDWWWKARLGKCYYQLGMCRVLCCLVVRCCWSLTWELGAGLYRDAERQFRSANREQPMVVTTLELCKVYIKLDQPNTAVDTYTKATYVCLLVHSVPARLISMSLFGVPNREVHHGDTSLLLGVARVYDMINDMEKGVQMWKQVGWGPLTRVVFWLCTALTVLCGMQILSFDASNVESIACLASHHFYTDQPEIALKHYRRLLQMGVQNTELWNNLGLCCFYASQCVVCVVELFGVGLIDRPCELQIRYDAELFRASTGVGE